MAQSVISHYQARIGPSHAKAGHFVGIPHADAESAMAFAEDYARHGVDVEVIKRTWIGKRHSIDVVGMAFAREEVG